MHTESLLSFVERIILPQLNRGRGSGLSGFGQGVQVSRPCLKVSGKAT